LNQNGGGADERVTPLDPPRHASSGSNRLWYLAPATALLVAAAGFAFDAAHGSVGAADVLGSLAYVEFALVGGLIGARRPGNSLGWVLSGIGLGGALNGAGFAYARWAYASSAPGVLPTLLIADAAFWLSGGLALGFVPLLFPEGRVASRRWRPVARMAGVALAVVVMASLLHAGVVEDEFPRIVNPHGVVAVEPMGLLAVLTLLTVAIASSVGLVVRARRSRGEQRQQMKWLALGVVILITGVVVDQVIVPGLFGGGSLGELFQAGLVLVIPTAVGIAILRHGLLDIDVVLSRTLTYGVLTAILLAAYVLVVSLLSSPLEPGRPVAASVAATAVVAVAFAPLRQRIQDAVDRALFGQRSDPYAVVSRLGESLRSTGTPEAILPAVVETVAQALRLPYVAVELVGDPNPELAAFGSLASEPVRFPLGYQDQELGSLAVGPRTRHDSISASERRLLEDLARLVSVVVYSVKVNADLQRSRERLVTAREEERRRLRRDLHDGLGPALAGAAFRAGAVQALLPSDPAAAEAQLVDLRKDVKAATQEIRRVVEGLRPPALDELGLVGAVRHLAESLGGGDGSLNITSVPVTVDAADPERLNSLPAAVEVAAYRIIGEALTNVFRHAQASACNVRFSTGDQLHIEVVDDGRGFRSPNDFGVGIGSMRDRAEELGGVCTVESDPRSGTTVRVRLPFGSLT
jgi:signal transduction histidine kinase